MNDPSPFGTLSTIPQEVKLEIYLLLLCRPSSLRKALRSCIEPLSQDQHPTATSHRFVDVAILQVSKGISAEAMNVFYSVNTFHIEIPAGVPKADQPSIWSWIFLLPSQQACEHIRDLKISFSTAQLLGPKDHDLNEGSIIGELIRKLEMSRVPRNRLTVDVFHLRHAASPWTDTYSFQALVSMTSFSSIEVNMTCVRRDGTRYFNRDPIVIEGTVKEGLELIWKSRRNPMDCVFRFQPRILLC